MCVFFFMKRHIHSSFSKCVLFFLDVYEKDGHTAGFSGCYLSFFITFSEISVLFFVVISSKETQKTYEKKTGDAPGPLGDFVKSLVMERLFLFFVFLL